LSPELAAKVMKVGVPGIYLQREYKRFYPAGEVTAHLVGFTGVDDTGQEGFELAMNASLSGKAGSRRVIKDRSGHIVEDLEAVNVPQDGRDLVLSIDRRIQYLVHRELAKAVELRKAKAGAAIILDAKSGEVLAMVNLPTYNPNNPVNIKGKTRNRAITDMFEPGSTLKSVAVAAGLESGQYQPDTKIQTAPGHMSIGPATIHDSHPHGILSVAEVIQKSSNVGASKIALSLDRLYLWNIFNQLGFGVKTNIGFPGEATGRVRDYKTWRPIEQATMSYGHGISVTLLQLARAYTVFANDGELKPVSLLKLNESPVGIQVFSPKTANQMKDMLEMVVQPGGTALKAQVVGYRVAGKTGTTHKLGDKGYEKNKYVGSFVGIAPASNPRLIMAVMIDEPSIENKQYYGGTVAAPVFSAVMADALRMLAVPQDSPNTNIVIEEDVTENVDDVSESI
jgi:cell division protein FtsI (penicillin-binding protein 3)